MNWSRGLFRAWVLGSALWLVGWSAYLLLEWPKLPAETAACEAVKLKGPTEPITDDEIDCVAFLRLRELADPRSVIRHRRFDIDASEEDILQLKITDECFVLTRSYVETHVYNPALEIKPDRTVMLRYELRGNSCQHGEHTAALSRFFSDIPRANVSNHQEDVREHIVRTTALALGLPVITFVLGWALLWVTRGFRRQ